MKTTRRRLFGLVGALAAVAAVPPSLAAAAAPAPTLVPPGADYIMVGDSTTGHTWRKIPPPIAGTLVSAAYANDLRENLAALRSLPEVGMPYLVGEHGCDLIIPTRVTTGLQRGSELTVTITADTSQLRAGRADLEAKARRLAIYADGSRWDTGLLWDA